VIKCLATIRPKFAPIEVRLNENLAGPWDLSA
jgi:hypothetical protein